MVQKRRRAKMEPTVIGGVCAVCAMRDARALEWVELASGERVTLCGSHALMHRRAGEAAVSVSELRGALGERRAMSRRAQPKPGEVDELAANLASAFTNERRATDRRAS